MTKLLLLRHLQSLLSCTIIQKPHVISHRHLTEETRASEAGLILQRSIHKEKVDTLGGDPHTVQGLVHALLRMDVSWPSRDVSLQAILRKPVGLESVYACLAHTPTANTPKDII